jgi:uroporphyrinogen decarboxylase
MDSRERMRAALSHKEPDRVPIDNNGFVSGMHIEAYKNLLKMLNFEEEIIVLDPVQKLALVSDRVRDMLGIDSKYIYARAGMNYEFKVNPDGTFEDEFGAVFRNCGFYADNIKPPLRGMTLEEIKAYRFPDPKDSSRFAGLREEVKRLKENSSYSLWGGNIQTIFYIGWVLRGMEDFMLDIYGDPKLSSWLIDAVTEWVSAWYEGYMDCIGDSIDVFWIADDWGTQCGPLVSPVYFRKEIVPRFKKLISFIKTKTNAKCCYHSCGSVYWCMEDILEMGVDIIQPVQANAEGNDTTRLKKEYGSRISFHGGTNNQGIFHKDIHSMSIDTLKRIGELAPGGGYIFSSGHNIQANMPPENILRFFELGREFGKYPVDHKAIKFEIEKEESSLGQS